MRRCFVIFFIGIICVKADPCEEHYAFPEEHRRDTDYKLQDKEVPISDSYIKEGWYGSLMNIPTAAPGTFHCGTYFPIWAQKVVSNDDGTLNVTMCTQVLHETCVKPFAVEAKACGSKTVYYLKQTASDSAYCLGAEDRDKPPRTSKPGVATSETNLELTFYCDFNKSEEDVFYMIYWYVNNTYVQTSTPQKWPVDRNMSKLHESTLKSNGWTTVGFYVYCSVRASYEERSAPSIPVYSEWKIVGIQIHTKSINLDKDPADISFQLTAPFWCPGDECSFEVQMKEEDNNQIRNCTPRILHLSDCGVKIKKGDWSKIHNFTIKPSLIIDTYDDVESTIDVKLSLNTTHHEHSFWTRTYTTENIVVKVAVDKSLVKGKSCHALSVLHIKTLDGRYYEHQYEGSFTLYTHLELQAEVQIHTSPCNGSRAYCLCGVTVRAGRSMFTIQRCPDRNNTLWFTLCDEDDVLDVRKRNNIQYEILIPSGTIIKVNIQGRYMNVYVVPSVHDIDKSRGLCGKLSDTSTDDFVLRDGTQSSAEAFSQSWRVNEEDNHFNSNNSQTLLKWDETKRYCDCSQCGKPSCGQVKCTPNESSQVCYGNWPKLKVERILKRCRTHGRKKRSVGKPKPKPIRSYQMIKAASIEKRDADDWINGWTNKSATEFCQAQFSKYPSIKLCRDISTVSIDKNIEDCVFDIWATGDKQFVYAAIDNAQTTCIQEVVMNSTFHKTDGGESIMERVLKITCPNGCSGKGDCVNGSCECHSTFSGPDCSVDRTHPPVMTKVPGGILCDINEDACTVISLFGETFVDSPNATCRFKDTLKKNVRAVSTAQVESIMEVACPIPVPRTKRSALGAKALGPPGSYLVSVSNDGDVYGSDIVVVIYNSTCQTCAILGITVNCTVAENYCTVHGQCVLKGEDFPLQDSKCIICDIQGDERTWQEDSDFVCGCTKASSMWTCIVILLVFVLLGLF